MLNEFRETAITWDKANRKIYESLRVSAGDNKGRKLSVQLVNDGVIEDLSGANLSLFWETRDKAHKGLDAFTAVDDTKGEFEIYYTTGMLSNEGTLNANLVLVDASGRVVSEPFKITVFKGIDDDAIQSSDSFTALTEALVTVSQYDGRIVSNANAINGLQNNKLDKTTFEQNKLSVEQQLQQSENEVNDLKISKAEKSEVEGTNKRIDELIIPLSPENSNIEVTNALVSVPKNKSFDTLSERFEEVEKGIVSNFVDNILKNPDFSDGTTNWIAGGGSISASNNILTINANSTSFDPRAQQLYVSPYVQGKKFYIKGKFKPTSANVKALKLWLASTGMTSVSVSFENFVTNEWNDVSAILTAGSGGTSDFNVWYSFNQTALATEKVGELTELMVIDLSELRMTVKDEIDKMLSYYPNSWFRGRASINNAMRFIMQEKVNKDVVQEIVNDAVGVVEQISIKDIVLSEKVTYGKDLHSKYSDFVQNWLKQDKNLNILMLGTSITAQYQGTTDYNNPNERPPMLFSKNIPSKVFDKLTWGNAKYRRFDHNAFAVTGGTWKEKFGFPVTGADATERKNDWGDVAVRQASETKFIDTTSQATIQYNFPSNAKICNLIYRTDLKGSENVTVTVEGGNGLVNIVDNDGNVIADANGYVFSQRESAATANKNKSKYNVRLRMKRVSGSADIPITITKPSNTTADRLLFWGIEYSEDDYIVSVINEAVSGGNIATIKANIVTMIDDSDIDLIIFEYPILNMGGTKSPAEQYNEFHDIVFSDNPYSLKTKSNNFADFKVLTWIPHERATSLTTDNKLIDYTSGYNARDYRNYLSGMLFDNQNIAHINAFDLMLEDAKRIYGNYYDAFKASDIGDGDSLTRDDTHINDNGTALICKYLLPAFEFVTS